MKIYFEKLYFLYDPSFFLLQRSFTLIPFISTPTKFIMVKKDLCYDQCGPHQKILVGVVLRESSMASNMMSEKSRKRPHLMKRPLHQGGESCKGTI